MQSRFHSVHAVYMKPLNESQSAAELHDSKGSLWLQTLDQSERGFSFLQQEQQEFNLDRFKKKLSAPNSNWHDNPLSLTLLKSNLLSLEETFPCNDNVGYVRARQIFPEIVKGPGWNRSVHGEAGEKGS